jgi:hypothetical protein
MNIHVVSKEPNILELKSTSLASYDLIDLDKDPDYKFIPGDRYLVIGRESYTHITKISKIHLGLRNEGYIKPNKLIYG